MIAMPALRNPGIRDTMTKLETGRIYTLITPGSFRLYLPTERVLTIVEMCADLRTWLPAATRRPFK